MKITITFEEKHSKAVIEALDLYSRLLAGQVHIIAEKLNPTRSSIGIPEIIELKKKYFPEMSENASYGIGSPELNVNAKLAYEVEETLVHAISWYKAGKNHKTEVRDFKTMMSPKYDEPMSFSGEPLPKATVE